MGLGLHYADNPRGELAINVSSAFTGIAVVVVALRLYTRFFLVRYAGIEDYMVIAAMLCSIGLTICIGYQASWGLGLHGADLEPEDMKTSLKAFWCSLIVYYLALGLTKAAILLQCQRIFTGKRFQIASWTIMAVVISYTIWTVFGSIFACVPVRAFWTKEPARCIDQFAMWFTNAAINILTDLAIIILPMPVIQSLNLPKRQKQALLGIFAIGGVVCLVSILRLQSLVSISNSPDPTYDNPPAASWSSVETNVGIVCSCLPLLRPLITRWLPGVFRTSRRSTLNPTAPQFYQSSHTIRITHYDQDDDPEFSQSKWPLDDERAIRRTGGGDIQVVTKIKVQVESGDEWKDRTSGASGEGIEMKRLGSEETLVRQGKETV